MTKSSVITNRLSITMAGLIIILIIFSTLISQPYAQHINYNKQGWAANSTPGIYQWHLPVFTGLENTPQVANTGKYREIEIFLALKNCRSL